MRLLQSKMNQYIFTYWGKFYAVPRKYVDLVNLLNVKITTEFIHSHLDFTYIKITILLNNLGIPKNDFLTFILQHVKRWFQSQVKNILKSWISKRSFWNFKTLELFFTQKNVLAFRKQK